MSSNYTPQRSTPRRRGDSSQHHQQQYFDPQHDQEQYYPPSPGQSNYHHHHYSSSPGNEVPGDREGTPVRSDAALRHDVLKILIATQRTEAEHRATMLARKTMLTHYCTTLLRWMEFTMNKVNEKEKKEIAEERKKIVEKEKEQEEKEAEQKRKQEEISKSIPKIKVQADEDDDEEEVDVSSQFHGVVRVGSPSSKKQTPKNSSGLITKNQNQQENFVAIPHATLHTLRRQWQKRVAAILERRSFFVLQQRLLNRWKVFAAVMKGNKEAYRALSSSESAMSVSRRRRRQVVLNSVEMQKTRAIRALGLRALFKWRLFTTMAMGSERKTEMMQKQAQAAAVILAQKQLMEKEEQERLSNTAPESLESLVQGLKSKDQTPFNNSSPQKSTSATTVRPAFFSAASPTDESSRENETPLDYSNPRQRNAASDIIIGKSCRNLKNQISRLKHDMSKMKDEIRQANSYIATECTHWNLQYQKKFCSAHSSSSDDASKSQQQQQQPPSWQYEKSILQRRAAAYDALLEDHRMLQESLKAAEEDIARLRSIAVLREMHSPNNNNNSNNNDQIGLNNAAPRIALQPYYHPLAPNSIGRTSRSGSAYNNNQSFDNNSNNNNNNSSSSRFAAPTTTTQQQQLPQSISRNYNNTSYYNDEVNSTPQQGASSRNYYGNNNNNNNMTSPGGAQVQPNQVGVNCFTL